MKDFTLYPEAIALKELGFNEPCFGRIYADGGTEQLSYPYKNSDQVGNVTSCSAPTYSQAFRFFREKYGLSGWVNESFKAEARVGVVSIKSEIGLKYYSTTTKFFDDYEEAELACLRKLIEIVKNK
jgi:hypothetical protein